jgi:hypothetical protein
MQNDNLKTQADFARHINKHRSYITQLKQEGRIVMSENGKHVLVNESLNLLKETADYNRDDVSERHAAERFKKNESRGDEYDWLEDADPNKTTLAKGRAIEQHYKALSARMDYKASIGDLVSKDEVKNAVLDIISTFRQSIENFPHRIAADLVGKDVDFIRSTLRQEVYQVLTDLQKNFDKKITKGQE